MDFIQGGVQRELSICALKVQVAALLLFLDIRLTEDPLNKSFLLARARCTPRVVKQLAPWDLSLVLNALTRAPFEPLREAVLMMVTLKFTFLLAITSCRRISDLESLSCKDPFLRILEDRAVINPDPLYLRKVFLHFTGRRK